MNFSSLRSEIRLFSPKNLPAALLAACVLLTSCQGLRTRDEISKNPNARPAPTISPSSPVHSPGTGWNVPSNSTTGGNPHTPVVESPDFSPPEQMAPPPLAMPDMPRIGVILSGGGAKTYAHIGFLQELSHFKIPLYAIAGIEFGAPMAALYANKELPNDVEWQMFKLKDDDINKRSLLGSAAKPADISVLSDFVRTTFGKLKVEDMKLPFACPAFNTAKNQIYLMSRGSVDALLPYCMPYPPLFKPYKNNVSAIREVKMVADYLRSKGANYILFVNAMGPAQKKPYINDAGSIENILWTEIASQYMKSQAGVDAVMTLATEDFGIADFDQRREIMQKGADSANKALKNLSKKWGL